MPVDDAVPAEALEAFAATFREPEVEVPTEVEVEQAPAVLEPDTTEVEAGTTEDDSDSFNGFDEGLLDVLPPELQAAVKAQQKSLQGEATRKFQEAAAIRKQYEGIDLDLAKNAVTYMERLSDPEFLVQAHEAMTAELERQGLTKAQATEAATTAIEEQLVDDDDYDSGSVDPRIASEVQELKNRLAQSEARESQREQEAEHQARLAYLANETLKQETTVRRDNPEWDDDDIMHLFPIAAANGGSMLKAAEIYRAQEAHFAKRLLAQKSSSSNSIATPPLGGMVQAEAPKKLSFEEAHAAALIALRTREANQ